jgi:hypothetical protein
MESKSSHLSAFPSRYTRAGVLWLQFRYTAATNGNGWIQYYDPSTTDASTTAATDYAAMALDAEQSITCNIPTPLPATSAANSTYDNWTVDYAGICNVWTIDVDAAQDFDGSRSKTNVFVRGRTSA